MKTTLMTLGAGLLAAAPLLPAQAQQGSEYARVISSVPVIQQVAVPQQVCSTQPVAVEQQKSGAGALMGAVAGGAVGNQIGSGGGRAVATMAGLLGGAMLGNRIEGSPGVAVQNQTTCSTQTVYENRTVGYNVTYEYAGRQYQVQTPQDPGPNIRVQVSPVLPTAPMAPAPVVVPARPISMAAPVVVAQAPVYAAPPYYGGAFPVGFYATVGTGWGSHHHHHGR